VQLFGQRLSRRETGQRKSSAAMGAVSVEIDPMHLSSRLMIWASTLIRPAKVRFDQLTARRASR
jgi:hypothetical protein